MQKKKKCSYVKFGNFAYNWKLRATGFRTGNSFEFFSTFWRIILSLFFVFDLLSSLRVSLEGIVNNRYRLQGLRKDETVYYWIGRDNTPVTYEIRRLSSGAVSQTINLSGLRPPVDINNPYEFHAMMYAVCRNVIPRSHDSRPNVPRGTPQQLNIF